MNIDAEWLYRKLMPNVARSTWSASQRIGNSFAEFVHLSLIAGAKTMGRTRLGRFHLAASWPTGSMVFWIAVILGLFLLADIFH